MPKVTVREYEHTTHTSRGLVPVGEEPAIVVQKSASFPFTSAVFNERTCLIRVTVDTACAFAVGLVPVADATAPDLGVGQTEYFGIQKGAGHRINLVEA